MNLRISGMFCLLRLLAVLLLSTAWSPAQESWPEHTIVLVDVSGSMRSPDYGVGYGNVRQARDLVDAVLADTLDLSRLPQWSVTTQNQSFHTRLQAGGDAVAGAGASVYFGLFGDRSTTNTELRPLTSPSIAPVFPAESRFTDQSTNIELARANTMVFARKHGISSYIILEITDAQAEDESFRAKQDEPLIDEFHSENCQISLLYKFLHTRTGLTPYKGKYYQLRVNCWKVALKDGSASVLSGLTISPATAAPGESARAQWLAANWKSGDPFRVSLLSANGQPAWSAANLTSNGADIPGTLPEGNYQVTVALESGRSNTLSAPFTVSTTAGQPGGCVLSDLSVRPPALTAGTPAKVEWKAVNWKSGDPFHASVVSASGQALWSKADVMLPATEIPGTLPAGNHRLRVTLARGGSNTLEIPLNISAAGPGGAAPRAAGDNEIIIFSPQQGIPVPAGTVKVAWKLKQEEEGAGDRQYKIQLTSINSPPVTQTTSSRQTGFNIGEAGEYRLTVSSDGLKAGSMRFNVEDTGNGSGWIWLVVLAAAAGVAVFILRRKPHDPEEGVPPPRGRRSPPPAAGFEGLD